MNKKGKEVYGYNLKFDVHFTEKEGINWKSQMKDVMLLVHLVSENEFSIALKKIGAKYLSADRSEQDEILKGKLKSIKAKKDEMYKLHPSEVAPYAIEDVVLTWDVYKFFIKYAEAQGLVELWNESNKYLAITKDMEKEGVKVDIDKLIKNKAVAVAHRNDLKALMFEANGGVEFNPNSVPQLRKVLNTTGSTAVKYLEKMDHPVAKALLEYRKWEKAITSFYNALYEKVDKNDKIHCTLKLNGTITGRLSCSNPNLQALPKRSDEYKIRELIIPPNKNYQIASFDYSQAELRLLAHYTKDPFLMNTYLQGLDLHQQTADLVGISRYFAKRVNFGIVYGLGANGLSEQIGIPKSEANDILREYHKKIPGIRQLSSTVQQIASAKKYIELWTGRRRHFNAVSPILAKRFGVRMTEVHKALSNLIQGGVSEIMRVKIMEMAENLKKYKTKMVLQVHDEILFIIHKDETELVIPIIIKIMEDLHFSVPFLIDGKIGDSWGSAKQINLEDYR